MTPRGLSNQETPTETRLRLDEGKALVRLAREAIKNYLPSQIISMVPDGISQKLMRKSGVFVTLNSIKPAHELRGCIGFPYPDAPLAEATIKAAIHAAVDDPRFPPVSEKELEDSIIVEVTVLTPPIDLNVQDRKNLPCMIEIGRHGLIIQGRRNSGLLLPQVATEWKWDALEFLTNCCLKAGLPPDSWLLKDIEVKVFEAQIFQEDKPSGTVTERTLED